MRTLENKNSTNFDIIREYVSGESKDILLDDIQKRQLNRWNFYIKFKAAGRIINRRHRKENDGRIQRGAVHLL